MELLQDLHKRRAEKASEIKAENQRHAETLGKLVIELQDINELIAQQTAGLDNEKIKLAEDCLQIRGWEYLGYKDRNELDGCIAAAIADVSNGVDKLRTEYFGCKNYDRFWLQRSDHPYGYGPRHGSTVFSIELAGRWADRDKDRNYTPAELDAMIYYLSNLLKIGQARAAASNTPDAKAALRG